MKNSSTYERKFKTFLTRLRRAFIPGEPELPSDPTAELIWSVLLEDSNEGTAKVALSRLTGHFVDFNELRVSRPEEIVEVLPNTLGDGRTRAMLIVRALQAVFDRFDKLEAPELRDLPKREARNFLASIGHMTPFVEGRVCLLALNVHAMPVDNTLVELLKTHGVVHPGTDPRDTQGFLERIVSADKAVQVVQLLEALRHDPARVKPKVRRRKATRKVAKKAARKKKK